MAKATTILSLPRWVIVMLRLMILSLRDLQTDTPFYQYEHWVFGVFSLNYTSARVSDIIPYSNLEPSVLGCITYWVQSSMFVPGSFEIPLVSDEPSPSATETVHTLRQAWHLNPRAIGAIALAS